VEFDFGNKKTRFSNDSNQKIVEIDHASAASTISLFNTAGVKCQDFDATTSTISLYDTAGVKCLDFDATTGKTTLYQKTGVGTATRKIMDVNPATPTTHNGLQTSSPININTAALPHYTSIQFLQSGDLFGFANTNSVGAAIDYTLRYKA